MKHARIGFEGQVHTVTVEAHKAVRLADGRLLAEDQVQWLPPATGRIFALGLNYADHAAELAFKPSTEPLACIKSPATYTGHTQQTCRERKSTRLNSRHSRVPRLPSSARTTH